MEAPTLAPLETQFDLTKIDSHFPLPSYRQYQREVIEKILKAYNDGYKYVLLEAPTGSGKSAIGFTIAQFMTNSYYLAPQKFLQDQLSADFGEDGEHVGNHRPMIEMKGRNAYHCNFYDRILEDSSDEANEFWSDIEDEQAARTRFRQLQQENPACDIGECKRDGESKLAYCVSSSGVHCPYFIQRYKAIMSSICLMNFHSFLYQTRIPKSGFGNRDLLILDEGHNTEDVLLKFVEISISDRYFQTMSIKFPKLETVQEYIDYFKEIKITELIQARILDARLNLRIREEEEWIRLNVKFNSLLESDSSNWVCQWEETKTGVSRTVTLKPIFIDKFAQMLFEKAKFVLMMSATILSKDTVCFSLGIDRKTAKFIRLGSTFPAEVRPILFRPSGFMTYNKKADTLPKLVEAVNYLSRFHQNERGIIHTHTFDTANILKTQCAYDVSSRFLLQTDPDFLGDKTELLERHKQSLNSIIVAPAMHEGLDLKDDLGRFQFICKVPYPSKADPQIAARMEISNAYYTWRTATKLVQSYGRIHRHDTDHGVTYVLDADFQRFVQSSEGMLPDWFLEAIQWE